MSQNGLKLDDDKNVRKNKATVQRIVDVWITSISDLLHVGTTRSGYILADPHNTDC